MKNYHLILKEDGVYLADLPPKLDYENSDYLERQEYDELYQIAINDAVKLKEQEIADYLLYRADPHNTPYIKNHPYKADLSGFAVSVEVPCKKGKCVCDSIADFEPCFSKVAILTPKRKEDTCKWNGNRDACGNETCWDLQECQKNPKKEANGEVITSYEALENEWQKSSSAAGLTFEEWLMRDFTITRKPKTT